jgi:hypothetical protein
MKLPLARLAVVVAAFTLLSLPAMADGVPPTSSCIGFVECSIFGGQITPLGFLAISGDVIVDSPDGSTVDGVYRIFNDFLDTGGGTGLGVTAELFDPAFDTLPDPSTYSFNFVTITLFESVAGVDKVPVTGFIETDFLGNGTLYRLYTAPEPATWELLGVTLLLLGGMGVARRRAGEMNA